MTANRESMPGTTEQPPSPAPQDGDAAFSLALEYIGEILRAAWDAVTARAEAREAALRALVDAAEAYAAIQDGATDARVGIVQPITVAEGNALLLAIDKARRALAQPGGAP